MRYVKSWSCITGALLLMLGLALANGAHVTAQEEDVATAHPAAIHAGTCEDPTAEPAFDLGNTHLFGREDEDDDGILDDDEDNGEMRGSTEAVPVLRAQETIDMSFNELLDEAGPHVVAVHQSAEEFGAIVACGAIGGIDDDGQLVIGLQPVDDSGVSGIAILDEDDAGFLGLGEDEVQVTVYVMSDQITEAAAVATPPPEETADLPTEVTIEVQDDGINPDEFTIAADTDVELTVTNLTEEDANFQIEALDINEDVPAGETMTTTINAPAGSHEYTSNDHTGTLEAVDQGNDDNDN